ncbi:MAG: hypothetical protein ACT4PV_06620 [Planctomycetaceae bacterium]
MKIVFDPLLVEEAVYLLARADQGRWKEMRARIDPLYGGEERPMAIAHLTLFRAWGAAAPFEELLPLAEGSSRMLVARPRSPSDEGAELLVGAERTVLVRVAPERLLEPAALRRFLRHEMRHVSDMLDPAFGYHPDLGVKGRTKAQENLVRDRYRTLWNLAIDAVEEPPVPSEVRRRQLARAFSALEPDSLRQLTSAFADPARRRHEELASAARNPWAWLGVPRRHGPAAGEPCPLCGFPTHAWSPAPPTDAIQSHYPDWSPAEGVCVQCADMLRTAQPCPPAPLS